MSLTFPTNPVHTSAGKLFQRKFGVSVLKFWQPLFGFDVIKFDKFVGTPDGVSCHDHVEKKFGAGSAAIIKALLDHDKGGQS